MAKTDLTAERLRELLDYNPETGVFTWRATGTGRRPNGTAGSVNSKDGYVYMRIDGATHLGHRLAWFYQNGHWPRYFIDHIDGDRANNRICNLRDVSKAGNNQNIRSPRINNQSGFLGVIKKRGKWDAQITICKRPTYIGTFDTAELAHEAYKAAKRKHHQTCSI